MKFLFKVFVLISFINVQGQISFSEQIIIDNLEGLRTPKTAYPFDIDGDNDLDLLAASNSNDKIVWYENIDGLGTFSKPNLISTSVNQPTSTYATDIDGDGDLDVLSSSFSDDKVAWYEN